MYSKTNVLFRNRSGSTPKHMFCLGIYVEVLKYKCFGYEYMLKYSNTNVLFRNRSGSTPIQMSDDNELNSFVAK